MIISKYLRRLPRFRELPPEARKALEAAHTAAAPCPIYAVGGYVRDLLLGLNTVDIDLVVEGDAIAVARRVGQCLNVAVRPHPRFGTARLPLPQGITLDLATARSERYPEIAALPEVRPAQLPADLARRDFSINAMAARVDRHRFGPLIDPLGGCEDLRRGRIRVLHERSFIDDPTRIFRAARFEARYGFAIARGTMRLIKEAVSRRVLRHLAGSRIFTELRLIVKEPTAMRIMRRLNDLGVLATIHPRLAGTPAVFDLLDRVQQVLAESRSLPLLQSSTPEATFLLALLCPLHRKTVVAVLRRLDPPRRVAEKLAADLEACRRSAGRLARAPDLRQTRMARLLDPLSPEVRVLVLAMLNRGTGRKAVSEYLAAFQRIGPLLKSEDL